MALETNLVSYYSLEQNAKDGQGSNDGTVSGAVPIGGKIGGGYDFDGVDDYITLNNGATAGDNLDFTGSFSISAWIKPSDITANTNNYIVGKRSATGYQYCFRYTNTGKLSLLTTGGTVVDDTDLITDDTWHHVVVTRDDSGNTIFYHNGSSVHSEASKSISHVDTDVYLGNADFADSEMEGIIDGVGFWDKVLTSTEVTSLYNSGSGMSFDGTTFSNADTKTNDMVSYYSLNGHTNDLVGSNNGTNNGSTLTSSGKIGQAYDFDGVDDYINIGDVTVSTDKISISAWINIDSFNGENWVVGKDESGAREFAFGPNNGGYLNFQIEGFNPSTVGGTAISTGTWHHIAVVFDSSTGNGEYFLNGSSDGTFTNTGNLSDTTSPLCIGRRSYSGYGGYINGKIDEVGIWGRMLSTTEFSDLYNSGNGKTYYDGEFVDSADLREELVSYYKLDETSGTTVTDSHGSIDGTNNGPATVGVTGKINTAYDFESADSDYISGDSNIGITGNDVRSISVWIKPESVTGDFYIAGIGDTGLANQAFYLTIYNSQIRVVDINTNTPVSTGTINVGEWYHLVVTHDGTDTILYINGTQNATASSKTYNTANNNIFMGSNSAGILNFDGIIDEVGFWKRTLTSSEVSELYNSGNGFAYPFTPDETITPPTQTLTLTQPIPIIDLISNQTITPAAQILTLSQPTPIFGESVTTIPNTQSLTLAQPTPTIDDGTLGRDDESTIYVYDETGSEWTEIEAFEEFNVKLKQNQIDEFFVKIPDIQAAEKLYIKEKAEILFLYGSTLILKGRIQKVSYKTANECEVTGYGMEATLLDKEFIKSGDKRVQYTNESAQTIAKELLSSNSDGVSPWIMESDGSGLFSTDYGSISMRYEHANRLTALAKLTEAMNYDWGVTQTGYDDDYFQIAQYLPSETRATTSQGEFNITGTDSNCSQTTNEKDITNLANYITALGYGDGVNQKSTTTYNASDTYSTLSSNITSSDTSITLVDVTGFPTSGEIRIAEERITYTGISTNTLTGCSRGANSTTALEHKAGVFVEEYEISTSPVSGSSIYDNGLTEDTVIDRDVLDVATLELLSSRELLKRLDPVQRIKIIPDEPEETLEKYKIGDKVTIADSESDLNLDVRIVSMDFNSYYGDLSMEMECSNRTLTFIEQMAKQRKDAEALGKYMQGSTNIYAINEAENCDGGEDSQLTEDTSFLLYSGGKIRFAQKKTINGEVLTSLTFKLKKSGTHTEDITFAVRKVSDDSIIDSGTIDSSTLTTTLTDYTIQLTAGTNINEEVYLSCEYSGGDSSNFIYCRAVYPGPKSGENAAEYDSAWADKSNYDMYYKVTYSGHPLNLRFFVPNEAVAINKVLLNFKMKDYRSYTSTSEINSETSVVDYQNSSFTITTINTTWTSVDSITTSSTDRIGEWCNVGFAGLDDGNNLYIRIYDGATYYPTSTGVHLVKGSGGSIRDISIYCPKNVKSKTLTLQAYSDNSDSGVSGRQNWWGVATHTHDMEYGIYEDTLSSESVDVYIGEDGGTMTYFSNYTADQTEVDITDEVKDIGTGKWVNVQFKPNQNIRIEANAYIQIFIESKE